MKLAPVIETCMWIYYIFIGYILGFYRVLGLGFRGCSKSGARLAFHNGSPFLERKCGQNEVVTFPFMEGALRLSPHLHSHSDRKQKHKD